MGMQVAIKPFPLSSEVEQKMMRREIQILENAARQCAHTCRMYGTCAKPEGFCIVMKLYEGTLAHALQKLPGDFPVPLCFRWGSFLTFRSG